MNLQKVKDADKKTYKTKEFNIDEFLRALDKVMQLNDNNIQFYTLENSVKYLGYNRSFRTDYNAIASLYRGTRKDDKYKFLLKYLTPEVVAKFDSFTNKSYNTKKRFAKVTNGIDIDEFIKAYKYYKTLNEGAYYTYHLEKSKELLGYNKSFGSAYAGIVAHLNGTRVREDLTRLLTDENMQKLKDCGFLEELRKVNEFNAEQFAQCCEGIIALLGTPDFAQNIKKFMEMKRKYENLVPEVQNYARNFNDDFNVIINIMTGFARSYVNKEYYSQLTKDIEQRIFLFAQGKNNKITRPFDIDKFVQIVKKLAKRSKYSSLIFRNLDFKETKEYGRDYSIDCLLVKNALDGLPAPAYIKDSITLSVKKELKATGFISSGKSNTEKQRESK